MAEQADSWRSGGNASSSWGRGGAFAGGSTRGGGGGGGGGSRGRGGGSSGAGAKGARGGAAGGGRGGGGGGAGGATAASGRRGGKGNAGPSSSAILPTLAGPMHSLNFIKDQFHFILTSGKIQAKWLDNPKNPIQNYIAARTLQPPNYQSEQGFVEGRREPTFRVSLLADEDHGIVGYGDAKQLKEAEKIAALHAMLQLEDRNLLSAKPTGPAKGQVAPPPGPSATMSDGTKVAPERAREYLEFFCETYKCGKPEVIVQEASKARGRKSVASGWRAEVHVAGGIVGEAGATNKKAATSAVYLAAAQQLSEGEYAGVWKQFHLTHKPGAPVSAAPHVFFKMSDVLMDDVDYLYGDIRQSTLMQKAPRYTSSGGLEVAKGKRREIGSTVRGLSEEALANKSKRLEEDLNNYQSDERVEAMRAQRASLPVQQKSSDVLLKIELNQVSIIMAATGSGKTTQIPQIIFDDHILQHQGAKCNIICTQPRRIAAISVAERVAKERGERVGQTVGYQVRFEHKLPQDHGSITFCTTGIFLRRLQSALGDSEASNNFLDNLTHIVVDEVHERDVETDLLLVVIKRLLAERKRLGKREIKLILMSATINPTLFQNYFTNETGRPAPVVEVPGRSFPVDKHYLEETVRHLQELDLPLRAGGWVWREKNVVEYLDRELNQRGGVVTRRDPNGLANGGDEAVDAIDDLEIPYPLVALMIADVLSSSDDGHVLVFMPGWEEIKAVNLILTDTFQRSLLGLNFNDGNKFEIHILHSSIPVADQQAVFEPIRHKGIRRIILATNIAETSITIPDVVYVVDTGRVKEKRFDPERHLSSLVSAWVGTSNLNQRAGRAGRHRAGEYYGVLSKARYDRLSVNQTVEMKRVDLSNVVMHIKALDIPGMEVEDVLDAAIEPPAPERVRAAMDKLIMVGALAEDKSLTSLGHVLLQLPVDAPMGKMCLYGAFFRCLEPTLTLAAVLTNRDPFMAPLQLKKEADAVKDSWCPIDFRSDALAILRAYTKWAGLQASGQIRASHQFCTDNFLSRTTLAQIQQVKEHLFQSMDKAGILDVVLAASTSASGDASQARRVPPTGPRGRGGPRGRWIDETHPDLNTNSDSTPLLAALIALASTPNFAIRHSEKVYRTSQDKNVYIHPSSVTHNRHTKHKEGESFQGERELYAFAEKMKNVSMVGGQSNSGGGGGQTMLKTVTRLDPLTYLLFGATKAKLANGGIMCDDWLPIRGDSDLLNSLELVKKMLDLCMLRVFQGIGSGGVVSDEEMERERERKRRKREREQRKKKTGGGGGGRPGRDGPQTNGTSGGDESKDEENEEEEEEERELRMSQAEVDDFHHLTSGLVKILDGYAHESSRYSQSNSRSSTRPATPTTVASSGVTSIWSHSQSHGSNGGSGRASPMTAPSVGFEGLSYSAKPSEANKFWRR